MKKIKKIIIVRHGKYSEQTTQLTDKGKEGVSKLIDKLQPLIQGSNSKQIEIWTSGAERAQETAEMFRSKLMVSHIKIFKEFLGTAIDGARYAPKLLQQKINESISEVIIVVGHVEHAAYFPKYLGLATKDIIIDYAEAIVIENKTYSVIKQD